MPMIHPILLERGARITTFCFDVDGVLTKGDPTVLIYHAPSKERLPYFERRGDDETCFLVPCDEHGTPRTDYVEYYAGNATHGELILEGYRFHTKDGLAVQELRKHGFSVYFVSGRNSPAVRKRAMALGAIPALGETDKLAWMHAQFGESLEHVLFVGDGPQDVGALNACGISFAPQDASPEAHSAADIVVKTKGGEGVLYEIVDTFCRVRGIPFL